MKLLLIEDNRAIADVIFEYFEIKGYTLDYARHGSQGYELAAKHHYDLIILDVLLPGMNGFEVCRNLRANGIDTPILMLTARDTREDMLTGFDRGADDYLVKPFDLAILDARVRALVRRRKGDASERVLRFGELELDLQRQKLRRGDSLLSLNPAQFTLLKLLMARAPEVVKREELSAALWGDSESCDHSLRTHIYQLRKIVDKPFRQAYIKTVAKAGYQLTDEDES